MSQHQGIESSPKQEQKLTNRILLAAGALLLILLAWNFFAIQEAPTENVFPTFVIPQQGTALGGDEYELTSDGPDQVGAAWFPEVVSFQENISLEFELSFGRDENGGEGIALVFHQDPAELEAVGNPGEELGTAGIANSLVIEFDTRFSAHDTEKEDHVAFYEQTDNGRVELAAPACALRNCGNLEDGNRHLVEVEWRALTHWLEVRIDGELIQGVERDLNSVLFRDNPMVYMGFTATTTGAANEQRFHVSGISASGVSGSFPVEWLYLEGSWQDKQISLNWATATESNGDRFEVEKSSDGTTFEAISSVAAVGNSQTEQHYSVTDPDVLPGVGYLYRIRQVDLDGTFSFSKTVEVQPEAQVSDLVLEVYPSPAQDKAQLKLQGLRTRSAFVLISDLSGKQWLQTTMSPSQTEIDLEVADWPAGLYIIRIAGVSQNLSAKLVKE